MLFPVVNIKTAGLAVKEKGALLLPVYGLTFSSYVIYLSRRHARNIPSLSGALCITGEKWFTSGGTE
jgi:hypothetical protein